MKSLTPADPETKSPDLHAENLAALRALFPELVTEGANGIAVNLDVLKQLVGDQTVTDAEEKYGLNWHGKRRARQLALTPSSGTLRPCPEDSVDWDTTQNLMIEGDNLEVLKLLQKSYAGKVKLIYIDPPYNTGRDFVYPDNFHDNIKNYLELTGQIGDGGKKLSTNTEASGRFHTDWLNMMYPRLKLARSLLREDGFLFASINDAEMPNLRQVFDDVFGTENCVGVFIWNTEGHTDNQLQVKVNHEYIMCYRKTDKAELENVVDPNTRKESNLWQGFAENSITQNGPGNPVREITIPVGFPCEESSLELPMDALPAKFFEEMKLQGYISRDMTRTYNASYPIRLDALLVRDFKVTKPCRMITGWKSYSQIKEFIDNGLNPLVTEGGAKRFYLSSRGVVYYYKTRASARNILTVLRGMGTTEQMRYELEEMGIPFQYPKPNDLIRYILRIGSQGGDLVADFFAGSCPVADAALSLAKEEGGQRRFLVTQLPEPCLPGSEAHRAGFLNIAEIGKKRIRQALEKLKCQDGKTQGGDLFQTTSPLPQRDLGFRVFKLASSNIRAWDPDRDKLAETLEASIDHLKTDRTEQDILFELLLKLGLDLCVPIETRKIDGAKTPSHEVHSIGGGSLLVCLSPSIPQADVEPLALGLVAWHRELKPAGETTVVFRDSAFADDVAKTNLTAILQQHGLETVRSL